MSVVSTGLADLVLKGWKASPLRHDQVIKLMTGHASWD